MSPTELTHITCPVCGQEHTPGEACPQCGYESHLMAASPRPTLVEAEQRRLETARRIWNELCELRAKDSAPNQGSRPIGFLITDRQAVYCLYEGVNHFGTLQQQDEAGNSWQQLRIPGYTIQPEHFVIEVSLSDEGQRATFTLRQVNANTAVYINSLTRSAGTSGLELTNNDDVLLQPMGSAAVRLKFRKNLNR